jgi:methionine-rich copper-binding protein CopC
MKRIKEMKGMKRIKKMKEMKIMKEMKRMVPMHNPSRMGRHIINRMLQLTEMKEMKEMVSPSSFHSQFSILNSQFIKLTERITGSQTRSQTLTGFQTLLGLRGRRCIILLCLLLAGSSAWAQTTTYNINDGSLVLGSGTYIINGTGTVTSNSITVTGGATANITLNNVNIDAVGNLTVAFSMAGATVNLTLTGTNSLKSGTSVAGLQVPSGSWLTINGTGSLTATGGNNSAGIGKSNLGANLGSSGDITINSGTVIANGQGSGAGIGGGGGTVTVTGGTVTANGGMSGAGISCTDITINGGTVTANGGMSDGKGIDASGGTLTITGGTVTAIGCTIMYGQGINASGGTGTLTITGGTVTAIGCNGNMSSYNGQGINASDGTFTITGGTVRAIGSKNNSQDINGQPKNGNNVNVYLNTLTVGIPEVANTAISAGSINSVACAQTPNAATGVYGIKDVKTDDAGKVYFFLPASTVSQPVILTASGATYGKYYQRNANNSNAATLAPPYSIALSPTGTQTFTAAAYGYSAQTAKTITIASAGYQATGALTVALSGTNATSWFTLSGSTSISTIAAGGSATFTVAPKTGLAAGTYTATVTVSGTNVATQSFGVSFTVNKKDITVSDGTISAKTYNGATAATVTGVTFSGLINSETFTKDADYSVTSAAFNSADAGSNKTVTMTVTLKNTTKAGNYNLTNGTGYSLSGQSIAKKNITVSGGTISAKTYNGATAATVTGVTFSGLENSESLAISTDYSVTSAAFNSAGAGSNKTVTMTVTLQGTTKAGNYNLTNGTGYSLSGQSIAKKDITVSGGTIDAKTYNGTTAATVTGVTFSGLENSETFTKDTDYSVTSAAFNSAGAGSNKTVTMTVTLQGTTKAGNYNLTNGTNYNLTGQSIGKKDITVTGGTIDAKTYNGTAAATVTGVTFSGLENSETFTKDTDYSVTSAAFDNANAGSNKTVTMTVTLQGTTKAGNYNLTNGTGYSLSGQSIAKKNITVTGVTIGTKTYDGTAAAPVTGVTFGGLENSESLAGNTDYTVSAAFNSAGAGSGKTVTVTVTLQGTTTAGNYNLTNGTGYSLTGQSIGKKDITVSGGTITPKTYNGTTAATVTGLTFDGLENSESLAIVIDYAVTSAAFTDADAGSGKTVQMDVTLVSNTTTDNYNLTNGTNYDLTGQSIGKKNITVNGGTIAPKTCDGTTDATVTGLTFDGLENSDSLVIVTDYAVTSAAFTDANAGSNKTVRMNVALVSNTTTDNYNLTNGTNYDLTGQSIDEAPLGTEVLEALGVTVDLTKMPVEVTVPDSVTGLGEITVKYNGRTRIPDEPGTYEVTVDIAAGATYAGVTGIAVGTITIPGPDDPEPAQREVILPSMPGFTTDPPAGSYSVSSGDDFVFTLTPAATQALLTPVIAIGRINGAGDDGVEITPNGDGTYTVRIRQVRQPLTIVIDFTTAGATIDGSRVWSHGGTLHITAATAGEARIYSVSGRLAKVIPVAAGETVSAPLPAGFYVVVLGGKPYKVFVE